MKAAGIAHVGGGVETLDLPERDELRSDEVVIAVRAAGVGNWDDVVRKGEWDVGQSPPMALGVEAAGTIIRVGGGVHRYAVGDEVLTHALPLRDQGAWSQRFIAAEAFIAPKPSRVSWKAAGAFAVPALTAEQVLGGVLHLHPDQTLLVHGAGGVTGRLLTRLATLKGAHVIATASVSSAVLVRSAGAEVVLNYRDPDWPAKVLRWTEKSGVLAAVNAAPGGAAHALRTVSTGGKLATITSDPPESERGIEVSNVYVHPDGDQLAMLVGLLDRGALAFPNVSEFPLRKAAEALSIAVAGGSGHAMVLTP